MISPQDSWPRVKKVLNSSVVLAVDPEGRESILLGRGIGFSQKPGGVIAEEGIDTVFLPAGDPDSRALVDLLTTIPAPFVLVSRDIIAKAQKALAVKLHPHLLLALTDHLHFAVQRQREGIQVTNRLVWEIKTYYPDEYRIGLESLELIADRLKIGLPADEAANIAFHLVNARNETQTSFDGLRAAQLISEIVSIASYSVGKPINPEDLNLRRFIIHLQFFVDRLFTGRLLADEDNFLYRQMNIKYPAAMDCAQRIRDYVASTHEVELPDEEIAYLGLHIHRLDDRSGQPSV